MTIINKTSYDITVSNGRVILPNESIYEPETVFYTISLHCEIGSCIIESLATRYFKNFGKIIVYEGEKSSVSLDDGKKDIIISEV